MTSEANYVAAAAQQWAGTDPLEQWVNAAPQGARLRSRRPPRSTSARITPSPTTPVSTSSAGPEPAGTTPQSSNGPAVDEWTVEYDDGEQAWRDHHELRPSTARA